MGKRGKKITVRRKKEKDEKKGKGEIKRRKEREEINGNMGGKIHQERKKRKIMKKKFVNVARINKKKEI